MSKLFEPGDTVTGSFPISGSTGAAVNADSTPTASIWRNGVVDGAVSVTLTNPVTGKYAYSFVIPGGYAVGDMVRLEIAATVEAIVLPPTAVLNVRLDNRVSTRLSSAGYADPPTALEIRADIERVGGPLLLTQADAASAKTAAQAGQTRVELALPAAAPNTTNGLPIKSNLPGAAPTVAEIADGVWDEALAGHATAGTAGKALSDAGASSSQVITRTGPHTLTALDTGIDGTVGLFVGDLHGITVRALVAQDPPGGTGATWSATTTDEATGATITSDAPLTVISEELGYFAYALAAGDTTNARRVRLTLKRTQSSDVRIFGPLVLNVRDR